MVVEIQLYGLIHNLIKLLKLWKGWKEKRIANSKEKERIRRKRERMWCEEDGYGWTLDDDDTLFGLINLQNGPKWTREHAEFKLDDRHPACRHQRTRITKKKPIAAGQIILEFGEKGNRKTLCNHHIVEFLSKNFRLSPLGSVIFSTQVSQVKHVRHEGGGGRGRERGAGSNRVSYTSVRLRIGKDRRKRRVHCPGQGSCSKENRNSSGTETSREPLKLQNWLYPEMFQTPTRL